MTANRRFLLGLFAGLAAVAWFGSTVVHRTVRGWFEGDVSQRARLALTSAQGGLATAWARGDPVALGGILDEMARDDLILGAGAWRPDGTPVSTTSGLPSNLPVAEMAAALCPQGTAASPARDPWERRWELPTGPVHLCAFPVRAGGRTLGLAAIVHDLSAVERREREIRWFMVAASFLLVSAGLGAPWVASQLAWRTWHRDLWRMLLGDGKSSDFPPVLRDVHDFFQRVRGERETEVGEGAWTAQRLKSVLDSYLLGERIVILANREPYVHERAENGSIRMVHPASGLVTALEPVMRACSGTWVAHGGGSADRETSDANGRLLVPPGEDAYTLRRVWLSEEEERGYYYGFSNEGLWPLCHLAHARPLFREEDWRQYKAVNQRFADAVCQEADRDDAVILVQDYHYALAPRMIRERLPRATIITFWHIPWPNAEGFGICPWRKELLEGLLGSSIVGFHTQQHCNNFLDAVDRFLESRIDREQLAVVQHGRPTLVRPYPISVEWPVHWLDKIPPPAECRADLERQLGLAPGTKIGVGVDRLDYTKGIEERLLAMERLLERFPEHIGKVVFVQLAAPSRTKIERYRRLNDEVAALAARINARFAPLVPGNHWKPILLARSHHEPPAVFRALRAADFCYVSSLHDGMNLVAKEFVASRSDERGVLILSQFTGAARELPEALIVNPYDLEETSSAIAAALSMSEREESERMRSMRAFVAEFNVYRWAGRMLIDAARLRRRGRFNGLPPVLPAAGSAEPARR